MECPSEVKKIKVILKDLLKEIEIKFLEIALAIRQNVLPVYLKCNL